MYQNYINEMQPYQYGAIPELNPIGAGPLPNNYGSGFPDRIDPSRQIGLDSMLKAGAGVAGAVNPLLGAAVGFLGNVAGKGLDMGMQMSNQKSLMAYQKSLNSPQQMMRDMKAAGINPAAAAQGIAGAPGAGAAGLGSASISPGTPNLIDTLANSENTRLNGEYLKSLTDEAKANAELKSSQNIGQQQENAWYDTKQYAWLQGALDDNRIKKSTANMLEQDEFYHGAEAEQHFMQTMLQTNQMVADLRNAEQEFLNKCAEYNLIMANIGLTHAEISEVWSKVGLNQAMINKVDAETNNINMDTALKGEQVTRQQIENDLLNIKKGYEQSFYDNYLNTGWYTGSTTNQNFMRLSVEGKTDEANALLNSTYDFARGQYGAKSEQTRKWINTAVGGLATVAGTVMLFIPGLQVPGVAAAAYGVNKLTSGKNVGHSYDYNDYSHIPD